MKEESAIICKQIKWTKLILETFLDESGINDRVSLGDSKAVIQKNIMVARYLNKSIVQQADENYVSVDTINRYTSELKKLYDETQRYSSILPKRENLTKWELSSKN